MMTRVVLWGTLSSLVFGAPGTARADDAEEKAVRLVQHLGGKVTRDPKRPGEPVVAVSLWGIQKADGQLKGLGALNDLASLDLSCSDVTAAGLKELTALKGLVALDLGSAPQVADEGLKELAALKGLTSLSLRHVRRVTDAGLKELVTLEGLKELDLVGTKVTDAGVADLQKALPNCKIKTKR